MRSLVSPVTPAIPGSENHHREADLMSEVCLLPVLSVQISVLMQLVDSSSYHQISPRLILHQSELFLNVIHSTTI